MLSQVSSPAGWTVQIPSYLGLAKQHVAACLGAALPEKASIASRAPDQTLLVLARWFPAAPIESAICVFNCFHSPGRGTAPTRARLNQAEEGWGERGDSNPRPLEPQSRALPTELRSPRCDRAVFWHERRLIARSRPGPRRRPSPQTGQVHDLPGAHLNDPTHCHGRTCDPQGAVARAP